MNQEELKKSLGEHLCSYCPWTNGDIEKPPYGGMCEGSYCDEALDYYLEAHRNNGHHGEER